MQKFEPHFLGLYKTASAKDENKQKDFNFEILFMIFQVLTYVFNKSTIE